MAEVKHPEFVDINDSLAKVAYSLDKAYMSRLRDDYSIFPFQQYISNLAQNRKSLSFGQNLRGIQIKRWVYNADELIQDGFKNLLGLFTGGQNNLALIIRRTPSQVEMFMAVKNEQLGGAKSANEMRALLKSSISGNFSGSLVEDTNSLNSILDFDKVKAISLLCGIPSEKSEDYVSQGLDKLLNGLIPKDDSEGYTIVFLSQPLSVPEIRDILSGYEAIATALTPLAITQEQYGKTETSTSMKNEGRSHSTGTVHAKTTSHNLGASVNAGLKVGVAKVGITGSYGYSWGKSFSQALTDSLTSGTSEGLSSGESESSTYTRKNYTIVDILEKIEETIKRINESQATGLWKSAIYFLSENPAISTNAASFLNAIMQGEQSYLEPPFIQTWYSHDKDSHTNFDELRQYIHHLTHPIFYNKLDNTRVSPTANVSTFELANLLSFPRTSVSGIPVVEGISFGREPQSLSPLANDTRLGCAYHMFQKEPNRSISIDSNLLTSHMFITGSTGAGKSNAIYTLLSNLCKESRHFLVVEPAKGEYKNIFGNRKDVNVFGTNPGLSELLHINPFSFPTGIHIYEHIDRLVEIFNVSWPMYAAMPAVLKDAIVRAYQDAGWDLQTSSNSFDDNIFPSFADVLRQIDIVMDTSEYSDETIGNYKGALGTRLRSLTNGINSLVFTQDEIAPADLFDRNVIIDLSRVGASDTKSLIMGILVLKLQEYRMSQGEMNQPLKHITVLEEAHNLLKRTSTEQTVEGSNLLGKSVEMLTNAIAEMRTYGEGFIIADQAPGLLDMAVIRNTNTKIILRLPDFGDRVLVGKSAALSENQVAEISRLDRGVAVVYQNGWLEPILCYIDKFNGKETPYVYNAPFIPQQEVTMQLLKALAQNKLDEIDPSDDKFIRSELPSPVKVDLFRYHLTTNESDKNSIRSALAYDFFNAGEVLKKANQYDRIDVWENFVATKIKPSLKELTEKQAEEITLLIAYEHILRSPDHAVMCSKWIENISKRVIL